MRLHVFDCLGNTALIYSASVGNDVATDILIRSFRRLGLNVDHVNEEGMTALLVAAKGGFIECATILANDGRANVSFHDPQNGMTAEDWARMRGCASPEVLPFSVNANQRLTRCGSTYVARRVTDATSAGYASTAAVLQSSAPVKAEVLLKRDEAIAEGTDGACEKTKQATEDQMKDGAGRMLAAAAALVGMKPRRKRNSLPTIKLWSSLDLPSQRSTSSPVYEESSPPPPDHHHNSLNAAAAGAGADEDEQLIDVKSELGRQQRGFVARKYHRDLVRADTEISRSCEISLDETS